MNIMNNREKFFSIVKNKSQDIMSWIMSFFDERTAIRLLGADSVPDDILPGPDWGFGASERYNWDKKIKYAHATGNFAIGVGRGACIAFGHGGPGEFLERTLETGSNYRISEFETGVRKEVRYNPHFYHHFNYPVKEPSDIENIKLPDPDDMSRYANIKEEVEYYKERDFIVYANLNGFFSGLHYYLYPYDQLLADLILEPSLINALLEKLGYFNLKAAEHLLKCGVDMITFCDDLGSGKSLLMSPELYREFFLPWHKKLAGLCHKYGALLHMHSHGNINKIIKDIYEAGIDLLNPNDPCDGMDLPKLKEIYGDRITFVGGIDKFFFKWNHKEQEDYLAQLIKKTGGGFILMDSGGVPENVTTEDFKKIRNLFDRICGRT